MMRDYKSMDKLSRDRTRELGSKELAESRTESRSGHKKAIHWDSISSPAVGAHSAWEDSLLFAVDEDEEGEKPVVDGPAHPQKRIGKLVGRIRSGGLRRLSRGMSRTSAESSKGAKDAGAPRSLLFGRTTSRKKSSFFFDCDVKVPSLVMKTYGEKWEDDVFVLFDNAVRHELGDCYQMLLAIKMAIFEDTCSLRSLSHFFAWWKVFVVYVEDLFDTMEAVVFPWLESVIPLEGEQCREGRTEVAEKILSEARFVENLEKAFVDAEPSAFHDLVESVSRLSGLIIDHFARLEDKVPESLGMFFNRAGKEEIDGNIREYVLKGRPDCFFPISCEWMTTVDPAMHHEWVERNMRGRCKVFYPVWAKKTEKTHFGLMEKVLDSCTGRARDGGYSGPRSAGWTTSGRAKAIDWGEARADVAANSELC